MKHIRQLAPKLERSYGTFSRILFTPFVIVDWHVLDAGGFSLLGGMIPVIPVVFLVYVFCLVSVLVMLARLLIDRQYYKSASIALLLAGAFVYANFNANQIKERQLVNARDALYVFLLKPAANSVWYQTPQNEREFRELQNDPKLKINYIKAQPRYHTYHFNLTGSGTTAIRVEVLLLREGKRFFIYRASDK